MIKLLLIFSFFLLLTSCASVPPEYVKNLKSHELLFANEVIVDSKLDLETIALSVGSDKSGFVIPDRSSERLLFEKSFPIQSTDQVFAGLNFHRVGQVLRLSADLDKRTSGFIKNEIGVPISISGMIDISYAQAIDMSLSTGATQAIAASTSSSSLINPTQGAGTNIASGLGIGLIAGAVHVVMADSAKNGIISKAGFGARMEETTWSNSMPSAGQLSNTGYGPSLIVITPGLVKVIFGIEGAKTIDYKNRFFYLSTVAMYRGISYQEKYPQTKGWEFRITNINSVVLPETDSPEDRYKAIKKTFVENNIIL